jgi:tRNA pseudouridine38-40 synthase
MHIRVDCVKEPMNRSNTLSPFCCINKVFLSQPLDINLMNEAAKLLLTYIDFQCFPRGIRIINTLIAQYIKATDYQVVINDDKHCMILNMVRAIVDTLINVGLHK